LWGENLLTLLQEVDRGKLGIQVRKRVKKETSKERLGVTPVTDPEQPGVTGKSSQPSAPGGKEESPTLSKK